MSAISIIHALPAFIIIHEDGKKGGNNFRVICEYVKDDEISTRHKSAVCVYLSHVDALIDAKIRESISDIKYHVINLSNFDFTEMYNAESKTLPVMVHWCWGAKEKRMLYRRNGCLVSFMNTYELPVNQETMTAELAVEHEGLKIYYNIRGSTLSDNFLDAIGVSAHTQHGQYDCKRTAEEAIKSMACQFESFGEVEQVAYYNSARMQWEFRPMEDILFGVD